MAYPIYEQLHYRMIQPEVPLSDHRIHRDTIHGGSIKLYYVDSEMTLFSETMCHALNSASMRACAPTLGVPPL